jgi:hypothetical protein
MGRVEGVIVRLGSLKSYGIVVVMGLSFFVSLWYRTKARVCVDAR